ncbi:hypothetical protein J4466_02495 [Candidatus Pacearchaeota archaeon]|nr:hypothetical protein [Candidatus Pacearchaeota archaeon]
MPTTIQIDGQTLKLLKKMKEELNTKSYNETIIKIVVNSSKKESLAGFLGKKSRKEILKDLRDKNDRF